jgi:crotonobetainyl-CoA:carnitine CoA-transferase CaiB-like acyl-CoA transferase
VMNKSALQAIFRERFGSDTSAYWLARLEEQDLLCAPVRTLSEALADDQTRINGMILEGEGAVERVRVVNSPLHMDDAPVAIRIAPPELGWHTKEVLAEFGLPR